MTAERKRDETDCGRVSPGGSSPKHASVNGGGAGSWPGGVLVKQMDNDELFVGEESKVRLLFAAC